MTILFTYIFNLIIILQYAHAFLREKVKDIPRARTHALKEKKLVN